MKKSKKLLVSIVVILIVLIGGVTLYSSMQNDSTVVALGSQKTEIDNELAIKSMDNVEHFKGVYWLNEESILGIKDQPRGESKSKAKLCIYNSKDKTYEEMMTANEKELMIIGDMSEDERYVIYSVLLNGDLMENLYNLYVLDLQSKTLTKLVENMTADSGLLNAEVFVAEGMKVYKCDVTGSVEEIVLPKELLSKLNDFTDFTFKDYINMFYSGETIDKKRLKRIESDYNFQKEHNSIRRIFQIDDKLFLKSENEILYKYDIDEKKFEIATKEEYKKVYNTNGNLNDRTKKEHDDNGNLKLWKINEDGEQIKLIEESPRIIGGKESPDKSKIAYCLQGEGGYVYDLDTDEKIKIFPEAIGHVIWNESSKEYFIRDIKRYENGERCDVTSIVKLND